MLKFINDKRINVNESKTSFDNFSLYIGINSIQSYKIKKSHAKENKRKLEILINIIINLNFMELLLNLIVKLTYERFYLRGINDKNTINMYYDKCSVSLCKLIGIAILTSDKAIISLYNFSSNLLKHKKYSYEYYFFRRAGR